MKARLRWFPALAVSLAAALAADPSDLILKAMRDELEHSRGLDAMKLEKPYFISYTLEDADAFAASATLGGLVAATDTLFRVPHIQVRVGDYQFDNTNFAGVSVLGPDRFPVDNSYAVLRRFLWLTTDAEFKSAVEGLARKRAALQNMSETDRTADFSHAEPIRSVENLRPAKLDRAAWLTRVRQLSAVFAQFPQVISSHVEFQAIKNVRYLVNSEGTEVRTAEDVMFVRVRANGQASNGMRLRDSVAIHSLDFGLLSEADLTREIRQVGENVTALAAATPGETYNGPVLFEGAAAAQLFAQLLAKNLVMTRRPVGDGGRGNSPVTSELEGRMGSRILPEWMDVVDDPTQKEWKGRPLFGSYRVDFEGVLPKPLTVVEKGELKNFLLTRQPVVGFAASNGRARMPGSFGASAAAESNLFVRAANTVPQADLRKKLLEICAARRQPYGILVRKLDFPSSAPLDEVRRFMSMNARDGSGTRPFSLPILIYKVYPDGKEELIRGVRFRELNVRSLRDIRMAGSDSTVFDYLENGAPLALMGFGAYAAECSVIAPSVILDDVEIRKMDEELPKLPIVPPPLQAAR